MSLARSLFPETYTTGVAQAENTATGDIHFGDTIELQFPGFDTLRSYSSDTMYVKHHENMYVSVMGAPEGIKQEGYTHVAATHKKGSNLTSWVVEGQQRNSAGDDVTAGIVGTRTFYLRNDGAGKYLTLINIEMSYPDLDMLESSSSSTDTLYTCENGIFALTSEPSKLSEFWSPGGLDTSTSSAIVSKRAGKITPCAPIHTTDTDDDDQYTHYLGTTGYFDGPDRQVTPGDIDRYKHYVSTNVKVTRKKETTRTLRCATPSGHIIDNKATKTYYNKKKQQCGHSLTCDDMAFTFVCDDGILRSADTDAPFEFDTAEQFLEDATETTCEKETNCVSCTGDYGQVGTATPCPATTPYCHAPDMVCSVDSTGVACTTDDGIRVESGEARYLYKSMAGTCSNPCIPRRVECFDGAWTDALGFTHAECTEPTEDCTGVSLDCPAANIPHGQYSSRYKAPRVGCNEECDKQPSVTCTDGILSHPDYIYEECVVDECTNDNDDNANDDDEDEDDNNNDDEDEDDDDNNNSTDNDLTPPPLSTPNEGDSNTTGIVVLVVVCVLGFVLLVGGLGAGISRRRRR